MDSKHLSIFSLLVLSTLVGCGDTPKATRIAVFADNQITATNPGGATQYSMSFFLNHLKLCKEQNVDVIMIPGDLVNNAITNYYENVNHLIKEVYGTDESKYPEFVYSMGNHEWYTSSENQETKAVEYFTRYSRMDTKALRKRSTFTLPEQSSNKGCDYYKVVNGIPFVSISCSNQSGILLNQEREELKSWFNEISKLPSVKRGGPIFVSHHYAIKDVTYGSGQGANETSEYVNNILKEYPQVILFSGDTHFTGVNERTINQVDYTSINIGSSSYSRHPSFSCTMEEYQCYQNISNSRDKGELIGDVANNYNKTPHIQIVDVDNKGNTVINRYFSTEDPANPTKLGLTWTIQSKSNKDNFVYTNERYQNKAWANLMYGKDGLSWDTEDKLTASIVDNDLVVNFKDITDPNYCEHYKVIVTGTRKKEYDFVSNYYKYENIRYDNSFTINENKLPEGDNYTIEVKAFDYFDNPSLNTLTTSIVL